MGHKVHPIGFRLGIIKDWQSKWYSDAHYAEFVLEDNKLRGDIKSKYAEAAISLIEIDRQAKDVTVTLHTARPGIVIGRGGQRVDEMRQHLEKLIGKKVRLNIQEIRQPELDAYLVARSVAEQIERRVAYRRAIKQAIFRTIQSGARGIKISCAGRLGNAEIARRQTSHQGQVPLHTLRADIDYGFTEAHTTLGRIGVKVWIYKGQVVPEKTPEAPPKPAAEAAPATVPAPTVEEKPVEAKPAVTVEAVALAPVPVAEEKPAKPRVRRTTKTAEAKTPETKATEAKATEAKPAEPKTPRTRAAAPKASTTEEPAAQPKKRRKAAAATEDQAAETAPGAARKKEG
ncbi:MAG: 30S ribosomal protein S3 [Chloroflexi bacterium RBG_16_56_11]|nr:MAG: 30S ribosomal protein S3 [Chloroflexi bacterium RBG_16_56_11]